MAKKPHIKTNKDLEARARLQRASPVVRQYPAIQSVSVELAFEDPEGRERPSPRGMVYADDMHLFFDFPCPLRDCQNGGFNASAELLRALSLRRTAHSGTLSCNGKRARSGPNDRCNLKLDYTMSVQGKVAAAA
jgi:hypothetical protein